MAGKAVTGIAFTSELASSSASGESIGSSPSAERMRTHRERRRRRLRCVMIEVREAEIDSLIRLNLLKPEMRNDTVAVIEAIYAHLDVTLSLR